MSIFQIKRANYFLVQIGFFPRKARTQVIALETYLHQANENRVNFNDYSWIQKHTHEIQGDKEVSTLVPIR